MTDSDHPRALEPDQWAADFNVLLVRFLGRDPR